MVLIAGSMKIILVGSGRARRNCVLGGEGGEAALL